ncbi:MAG: hypothetical protein FJX23_00640 [Alphaproteobacteria bacterium]|nr:hypothetical protein [Alphaproteobacteria bacterium]
MGLGKRLQIIGFVFVVIGLGVWVLMAESGSVSVDAAPDVELKVDKLAPPIPVSSYNPNYKDPQGGFDTFNVTMNGRDYSYAVYPPVKKRVKALSPVVVLLHGSQRTAYGMLDMWKKVADENKFVIIAPNAGKQGWLETAEEITFIKELPSFAARHHNVDSSRKYLFGHSAGGNLALKVAEKAPEAYAAIAVHTGMANIGKVESPIKPPILFIMGTKDEFYPLDTVKNTAKRFVAQGYQVAFYEIEGHTHWYYDIAPYVNRWAWHFLSYYSGRTMGVAPAAAAN